MDNLSTEKLPESELFSERLAQAIDRSPLKGKEIAEKAGIDPGYLSNLKQGKRPAPSTPVVRSLAEVLSVSAEWLLGLSDTGPPASAMTRYPELAGSGSVRLRELTEAIYGPRSMQPPLALIKEIREEIHESILNDRSPSPKLVPLINQIEEVLFEISSRKPEKQP